MSYSFDWSSIGQWEYWNIVVPTHLENESLAQAGDARWELVQVLDWGEGKVKMYFKRDKSSKLLQEDIKVEDEDGEVE